MSNHIVSHRGDFIKLDPLDEFDIMEIRKEYFSNSKITMKNLSDIYHTSVSNIYKILNHETWKWVKQEL